MTTDGNVFVIYSIPNGIPVMVIQDGAKGFDANYWVAGIVNRHNKRSKNKWDWNCVPIHDSIERRLYRGQIVSYRSNKKFKDEKER